MKDYRVIVKIQNNLFFRAMQENGFETAASLSVAAELSPGIVGQYLNLKKAPRHPITGVWVPSILKISKVLKRLPEDLFPPGHLKKALPLNTVSLDVDQNQMKALTTNKFNPRELLSAHGLRKQMLLLLHTLTPREEHIIRHRYEIGCEYLTYRELSKKFNIAIERARQIEYHALRKLRHPSRSKKLLGFTDQGTKARGNDRIRTRQFFEEKEYEEQNR